MKKAHKDIEPPFTAASLVNLVGLEGDQPDERELMERFMGGKISFGGLRALFFMKEDLNYLISATNEYAANPAQETIAQALGAVVTRQVEREGAICSFVQDVAGRTTREDIIPEHIRVQILNAPLEH
ncbi:MAG TPA: hypothetical protein VLF43_00440 [Candidatus Saccharimonadales bacterium]|nr:hypothetical protein [Candidatus Saccharimonadales bacterium]